MKKLAVWITFIFVVCLDLCAPKPMKGQSAPFKLGDSVEVQYAGQWVTGVVTKDLESGTYGASSRAMLRLGCWGVERDASL